MAGGNCLLGKGNLQGWAFDIHVAILDIVRIWPLKWILVHLMARLRPRFEIVVPCPIPKALDQIKDQLEDTDSPFTGLVAGKHVHLKMRPEQRRIWSPHLVVELLGHREGTRIKGHYGPRADVWTLVVALYAMIGFLVIMGVTYGISQWMIGESPSALWTLPIGLLLAGIIYALVMVAQRMAQDQMQQLRTFVECSITDLEISDYTDKEMPA